eukprot:9042440-Pyramimonas_sp.AAC.1
MVRAIVHSSSVERVRGLTSKRRGVFRQRSTRGAVRVGNLRGPLCNGSSVRCCVQSPLRHLARPWNRRAA